MFEYIVLSGGGPNGLGQLGIIKMMMEKQLLDMTKIKKVYGTSAGAGICSLLVLNIDVNQIIDYLIRRPWNKIVKFDVMCLNEKKGMIDNELMKHIFFPLMRANDIPVDITLKEMYDRTKIELNIMTTELGSFTSVTLNHLTFPDLKMVDACRMSASIPPIFTPVQHLDKFYIDGGLLNNYPIQDLMGSIPTTEHDKILSIRVQKTNKGVPFNLKEMTSLEYAHYILSKSFGRLGYAKAGTAQLTHEIICSTENCSSGLESWKLFMGTAENRQAIYQEGVTSCELFLDRL